MTLLPVLKLRVQKVLSFSSHEQCHIDMLVAPKSSTSTLSAADIEDLVRESWAILEAKQNSGENAAQPPSPLPAHGSVAPNADVHLASHLEDEAGTPAKSIITRKKARKSRLSQVWGPADLEAEPPATAPSVPDPSATVPSIAMLPVSPTVTPTPRSVKGKKGRKNVDPLCVVCGTTPFHLRFQCPVITAGPESIERRLQELKASGAEPALLVEMQEHLRRQTVKTKKGRAERDSNPPTEEVEPAVPSLSALPPQTARDLSPEIPLPSSPAIPAGSEIDEVLVQGHDEGSSSESDSDDEEPAEKPRPPTTATPLPAASQAEAMEASLEALLRGPATSQSILARFEAESSSEEEDGEDIFANAPQRLASEEDEREDRAFRRLSRRFERDAPSSTLR